MIDFQVEMARDQAERTESLLRISITMVAGAVAAIGLLVNSRAGLDAFGFFGVAIAVSLNVWAAASLLRARSGLDRPTDMEVGPEASSLVEIVFGENIAEEDVLGSTLEGFPHHVARNGSLIAEMAHRRMTATKILLAAIVIYLATLGYIAGGAIVA